MGQGEARLQGISGTELATTIYEIGLLANESGDLDSMLYTILQRIISETGATWVGIEHLDERGEFLKHLCALHEDGSRLSSDWRLPLGRGVVSRVVEQGVPACIDDVSDEESYVEVLPEIRSEAAFPLKIGDEIIGALNAESRDLGAFGPAVMALLSAIATPVALTIRNGQLFERERRRTEQLSMLHQVSSIIMSTVELDELLERTASTIREQLGFEMVSIGLVEGKDVVLRALSARGESALPRGYRQAIGRGITGKVVATGESMLVRDVELSPDYTPAIANIASEMCCPLRVGEKVIGFLDVESSEKESFDERDLDVLQTVADHISQAVENARNLASLEAMREDLVAMVVHDLRNPLTVIQSALDILTNQLDSASARASVHSSLPFRSLRKYLLNGQSAGQEMLVLINGLLDLQKMESGAHELRYQRCLPADLVNSVAQRTQVVADAHSIRLSAEVSPDLPSFECDIDLVSRVLENLLSNALKYTPAEGAVKISVSAAPEKLVKKRLKRAIPALVFAVEDTGPGIPHEDRERIFEKFAVVKLRRRAEKKLSTGLGLAFCRHAIKAHGGDIWIESGSESGSRFCALLPSVKKSLI